jgi:hypothetical protein
MGYVNMKEAFWGLEPDECRASPPLAHIVCLYHNYAKLGRTDTSYHDSYYNCKNTVWSV